MIVGTAGHIDHGKTTLIRALTGVDTDRLEEEKKRGISIQLGYAYTPLPDGQTLGFIDVPGHERLVHTMVAGATGIDFGLLIVAVDDGVMPQTREHLAVLQLLGLDAGAIVLSKAARADAARIETVKAELQTLVQGSFLDNAPVFVVDALSEAKPGLEALRQHLHTQAMQSTTQDGQGYFRLAIDRVFTLQGHGTVVTGTVHDGVLDLDGPAMDLRLMPRGTPVRVRSIHAQNQASRQARAGQRCALNLGGIDVQDIERGDWLADARCFIPSTRIDVELSLLDKDIPALRTWSPWHVHMGAAHLTAHAVPLDGESLQPGKTGKVQLVFDRPICTVTGERFILRNAQASETVGGGIVLDPNAPDRKRRSTARLAWLDALAQWTRGGPLEGLLAHAPYGLDEATLLRLSGGSQHGLSAPSHARWHMGSRPQSQPILLSDARLETLCQHIESVMLQFHERNPDEPGLSISRLRRMAAPTMPDAIWQLLTEYLLAEQRLARQGAWLHTPGHRVTLSAEDQALATALLPLIEAGRFDPPWTRDLAKETETPEEQTRNVLRRLVRQGELFQIVHDLFYHRRQIAALAHIVKELHSGQGVSAAQFRDATGLGRKRAIQILEFFDRVGYTRRVRDRHVLRGEAWT
ncbi:selenocysteine-specific translation elongation factor [Alcaligenes aquatilis]|uniref:selenocysteine-specific translation elongation factor n=1 Tax=Alcaligenes aquatilis TaxID=323284 RepID=UPI000F67E86B|nr:selenocysteine-specific translation elongation factor [Alcaligenes aquatilis]QXR35647.1 selenocysteine-specific translation elongation factor [Alcaligenes aquatilis]